MIFVPILDFVLSPGEEFVLVASAKEVRDSFVCRFFEAKERKFAKRGRKVAIAAAVMPIAGSTMDHFTRLIPCQL